MINTVKDYAKLSEQYNKMMAERNSLIDDIVLLRANNKRFERHNKDLRLQADTYFDEWQQHKALNNEISQHIGNKPSSSTYKYFRAKLDNLNITEDE
ncbi:hypothetical protein M4L38_01060 [Staphylococcus equorum]|uniref:hypothetical protein n=1 Tax=Staphylococcus equorum TaxID=246432 RepID=UPI0024087E59|nr:hypothetical protein [Staphylococcus equorum]MDG0821355.1 hypothetical protein [Staphylococcus equorum]